MDSLHHHRELEAAEGDVVPDPGHVTSGEGAVPSGELVAGHEPGDSGRLAERVRRAARERGWPWAAEVEFNPDRAIINSGRVAVTSDSNVLDRAARWLTLSRLLVGRHFAHAWLLDLA